MAEWIKTADKFPDVDRFLGISKFQRREKVHIYEKRPWEPTWAVGGYDIAKDIIWWMPLPALPEEQEVNAEATGFLMQCFMKQE